MATEIIQGTMNASDIGTAAQRQYYARPVDQKFMDLDTLIARVEGRRNASMEFEASVGVGGGMTAHTADGGGIEIVTEVPALGPQFLRPSHWAFGQICQQTKIPAAYMRTLAEQGAEDLVVKNLNHGLAKVEREAVKFLALDTDGEGDNLVLNASTSPTYGRIWDADVANAAKRLIDSQNGTFYSPLGWGKNHRALFAGDRSIFMFFIDGGSIVDGGGERDQLNRGIYIWNSEVGSATFGISTFLFRACCGNFAIWDVQNAKVLNIRHTSGGPERFLNEAIPAIDAFAHSSVKQIESTVHAAKAYALPTDKEKLLVWAKAQGFNGGEAKRAIAHAESEEGQCASLWDYINGVTASARLIAFADAKAELEARGGKLLKLVETN